MCDAARPDLGADLDRLDASLGASPAPLAVTLPTTGETRTVALDGDLFLAVGTGSFDGIAVYPYVIEQAPVGDYALVEGCHPACSPRTQTARSRQPIPERSLCGHLRRHRGPAPADDHAPRARPRPAPGRDRPPEWGAEAAADDAHAHLAEFPAHAHVVLDACAVEIMGQVMADPDAEPDMSCIPPAVSWGLP